jgi:hypothetical protein
MSGKKAVFQELGRRRWVGINAEARSQHGKYAVAVREEKRREERARVLANLPKSVAEAIGQAASDHNTSAYASLGYRLGLAHCRAEMRPRRWGDLLQEAPLERLPLNRKKLEQLIKSERVEIEWMLTQATLRELKKKPWRFRNLKSQLRTNAARLRVLERAKKTIPSREGKHGGSSAWLREIFCDSEIVRLIPDERRRGFLTGLMAGSQGQNEGFGQWRRSWLKHRGA